MGSWGRAAAEPAISEALLALHEHAANVAALHRPVCLSSGRCCHFADHGHVLLVTGLEAAWVYQRLAVPTPTEDTSRPSAKGVCAHLKGGQCAIHSIRPLGCRAYFCDAGQGPWQATLAESLHSAVRRLHDEYSVEYLCAEWTWLAAVLEGANERGLLKAGPLP